MCNECGNRLHVNLYPDSERPFREGVSTRPNGLANSMAFENGMQNSYMGGFLIRQDTAPIFVASYNFRGQMDIGPLTQFDVYRTTITPTNGGGTGGRR